MKRGVRALLKNTAPGKFVRGKYAGYRVKSATGRGTGVKLRGITKLLTKKLYSSATPPSAPRRPVLSLVCRIASGTRKAATFRSVCLRSPSVRPRSYPTTRTR